MDAITTNKSCVAQSEPAVVFVSESGVWAGSISPPIKQKQQLSIKKRIKKVEVKNLLVMREFNKNSWKNPICKLLQKKKQRNRVTVNKSERLEVDKRCRRCFPSPNNVLYLHQDHYQVQPMYNSLCSNNFNSYIFLWGQCLNTNRKIRDVLDLGHDGLAPVKEKQS